MTYGRQIREVLRKTGGALWTPEVGEETIALLQRIEIPDGGKARLVAEAAQILAKCAPPESTTTRTGLAIGYVQSGKTMSFTTLAALARDNHFGMVVLVAGTSIPLFQQSLDRLHNDLGILARSDRAWWVLANPAPSATNSTPLQDLIAEHGENNPVFGTRTALVVVMKHHKHLANLTALLQRVRSDQVPTLIIDDEADQASLNAAVRSGDQTRTYERILELRSALPRHSYVQYTATPQAPLLINIIDRLSPEFAEVLTPGDEYTGGADFFAPGSNLVRSIPEEDLPTGDDADPAASLLEALRLFFLGVVAGYVTENGRGVRSMMVHPSQRVSSHDAYYRWVVEARELWMDVAALPDADPDKVELRSEFEAAWVQLASTATSLPDFGALWPLLGPSIRRTRVHLVNAARGETPQIDWRSSYAHILVGGQAMDRGFTVEGLTVTYMPRNVGVGNADTVQQRARFFGYKKSYLGYCRVFLNSDAFQAYSRYVLHEEDIRLRIASHTATGAPLSEWKREFFLASSLKPTRDTVLDLDYMRVQYVGRWLDVKVPHDSADVCEKNQQLVNGFADRIEWRDDDGHPERTDMQRHKVAVVPLAYLLSDLLMPYRATWTSDSQLMTGVLLQIQRILELSPSAESVVFMMSGGKSRRRSLNKRGEIDNIYQGAHPDKRGRIYPGDQKVFDDRTVTVQIHMVDVHNEGQAVFKRAPVLAVRIPSRYAEDLYIQLPE